MFFLIEYDRKQGSILTFRSYADDQRKAADDKRLEIELNRGRAGLEREVVLLQASSEAALRRTHRRYFENIEELARQDYQSASNS